MIYYRNGSNKPGDWISTDDIEKAHEWHRERIPAPLLKAQLKNGPLSTKKKYDIQIFECSFSKRNIDYMEGIIDVLKMTCKNIVFENVTEHIKKGEGRRRF